VVAAAIGMLALLGVGAIAFRSREPDPVIPVQAVTASPPSLTPSSVAIPSSTTITQTVTAVPTGSPGSSATSGGAAALQKGGTLTMLNLGPHNGLDPQQSYVGADLEFAARAYARSLVTYSVGKDSKLVPDLATDTGTMTDGGKTWKFTLVDNAKWQDGQPVKCDDVKYGISRTFATDVISNGPTYILNFLDVPPGADGAPFYKGPYKRLS